AITPGTGGARRAGTPRRQSSVTAEERCSFRWGAPGLSLVGWRPSSVTAEDRNWLATAVMRVMRMVAAVLRDGRGSQLPSLGGPRAVLGGVAAVLRDGRGSQLVGHCGDAGDAHGGGRPP